MAKRRKTEAGKKEVQECNLKRRAQKAQWSRDNPNKTLIRKYKAHAQSRGLPIDNRVTEDCMKQILSVKNCPLCKKKTKLWIDHIVPISWGGTHSRENIRALCQSCNVKRTYTLEASGLKPNEDALRNAILAYEAENKLL
jgi:5-methylcytosine-specific restriction endonuclease McrA